MTLTQTLSFQSYKCYRGASIPLRTLTLADYVQLVRDGHEVDKILAARAAGDNSPLYVATKEKRLCFTLNFTFDGRKTNDTIVGSTGLMYFDVDNPEWDPATLDKRKVVVLHRSFGGEGWAILVRVQGVTKANFAASYRKIAEELGLAVDYDKGAKKMTQYCVCSYDPDVYINEEAEALQAAHAPEAALLPVGPVITADALFGASALAPWKHVAVAEATAGQDADAKPDFKPLRFNNASDFAEDAKGYTHYPGGVGIVKISMRTSVEAGGRNKYLCALASQLLALNPSAQRIQLYKFLKAAAAKAGMYTSFSKDAEQNVNRRIEGALNTVYKYLAAGTLTLAPNVTRKTVFGVHAPYTTEERNKIARAFSAASQRRTKTERLHEAIEDWSSPYKITTASLAEASGLKTGSVKAYLKNDATLRAFADARNLDLVTAPAAPRGKYKPRTTSKSAPTSHASIASTQDRSPEISAGRDERPEQPPHSAYAKFESCGIDDNEPTNDLAEPIPISLFDDFFTAEDLWAVPVEPAAELLVEPQPTPPEPIPAKKPRRTPFEHWFPGETPPKVYQDAYR